MRSFIAIPLPDAIREELAARARALRPHAGKASWVRPERMHLTLRFLGEITPEQAEIVAEYLASAWAQTPPIALELHDVGAFPNVRRPSVIVAEIGPLEGPLQDVQRHAEAAAQVAGLPPEDRSFKPHVTLARIRRSRGPEIAPLRDAILKGRGREPLPFAVRSAALLQSLLTPAGPVYDTLREFRFS